VEPFVPGEEPKQPDLSKIFPESGETVPDPMGAIKPSAAMNPNDEKYASATAGADLVITGSVSLSEGLADQATEGVLFIIARKEGMRPPLAVKRVENPSFPLTFSLGPDDRMIDTIPFEGSLEISVRLDGDGNAMSREPGDLQSAASKPVEPGAEDVELVLDTKL
jgi:cytochrome c-type biogenesis protein CcmH